MIISPSKKKRLGKKWSVKPIAESALFKVRKAEAKAVKARVKVDRAKLDNRVKVVSKVRAAKVKMVINLAKVVRHPFYGAVHLALLRRF